MMAPRVVEIGVATGLAFRRAALMRAGWKRVKQTEEGVRRLLRRDHQQPELLPEPRPDEAVPPADPVVPLEPVPVEPVLPLKPVLPLEPVLPLDPMPPVAPAPPLVDPEPLPELLAMPLEPDVPELPVPEAPEPEAPEPDSPELPEPELELSEP